LIIDDTELQLYPRHQKYNKESVRPDNWDQLQADNATADESVAKIPQLNNFKLVDSEGLVPSTPCLKLRLLK
jgi:hypothetical protein